MEWPSYTRSQQLALAGGALAIVSAVLPWLTIADVTVLGYYDEGLVGVMSGISIVGVVLIREWSLLEWLAVAVFGILTLFVAGRSLLAFWGTPVTVRVGLYVQLLAGVLALLGAGYAVVEPPESDATGEGLLGDSLGR